MARGQILISIFIVAVSILKVSEVTLRIESFPLTYTGLFQDYEPVDRFPWTFALEGYRGRRWREIRPFYLGLTPSSLGAKLGTTPEGMDARCGAVVRQFNAVRKPRLRYERARVFATGHGRPGTHQVRQELEIDCPLEPPPGSVK